MAHANQTPTRASSTARMPSSVGDVGHLDGESSAPSARRVAGQGVSRRLRRRIDDTTARHRSRTCDLETARSAGTALRRDARERQACRRGRRRRRQGHGRAPSTLRVSALRRRSRDRGHQSDARSWKAHPPQLARADRLTATVATTIAGYRAALRMRIVGNARTAVDRGRRPRDRTADTSRPLGPHRRHGNAGRRRAGAVHDRRAPVEDACRQSSSDHRLARGDTLTVTLQRSTAPLTRDQAFWVDIRETRRARSAAAATRLHRPCAVRLRRSPPGMPGRHAICSRAELERVADRSSTASAPMSC